MGEKQSKPAAAAGGDASVASQDGEANCGGATDAALQQTPPSAEADGAGAGQAGPNSDEGAVHESFPNNAVPSESEILARLVANLGQSPGQSMALAEIRERLPPALRRLTEDTENICKWLRGFPCLFKVSGPQGEEQVTLTVIGAPPGSAAPGTQTSSVTTREANATRGAPLSANDCTAHPPDGGAGLVDEDGLTPSTVQLRGLPFRATIADIRAFLGAHAKDLVTQEPAIRVLLNRDGRPSGFARVQFTTPHAAQACREALHRKPMGDRYVEVLACSDRARARHRRAVEAGPADGDLSMPGNCASEYLECERVFQECQDHMRLPGRNELLLSMLGIALSQPARAYLRRANLGLKHFLARFPNEFRVEGPKGCERVIWCGAKAAVLSLGVEASCTAPPLADAVYGTWPGAPAVREPSTPRLAATAAAAGLPQSGHCARTPSDWGTPAPLPSHQAAMPEATAIPGVDFGAFPAGGAWPPYGWPPPWPGQEWMPWQAEAAGLADGSVLQAVRDDQSGGRQALPSSGKRSARGDASASRSHAHLHPQSHPFANRSAGSGGGASAPGVESVAASADGESKGPAIPALRLRGLPFNVTVQDVLAFFAQHEVADRIADGPQAAQLLPKANGRPSGQAVVQMRSRFDAEIARNALCNQFIGGRYIEVFVYGEEMDSQGQDAGVQMGKGLHGTPPWSLPPWAGVQPPPMPASVALGGMDTEARDGEAWGEIFNWLWHGQEQASDMGSVAAADGTSGPMASGPGAAAMPASAVGPLVASIDRPARATLQV